MIDDGKVVGQSSKAHSTKVHFVVNDGEIAGPSTKPRSTAKSLLQQKEGQ